MSEGLTKIAIIAALPREVAGLVRGLTPDRALKQRGIYFYRLDRAVIVCGGMGAGRATLAVEAALAHPGITTIISAGLAGACDPKLAVGTVVEASTVIESSSGERFATDAPDAGSVLVSTHMIAGVREKQRLHASYGASIVDMEAATVARLARMRGLAFRAIKAISDAHDFELASLSRFASPHGHFRTRAFALHTALRPHTWRHTLKLGAASQRALIGLNASLEQILKGHVER